MSRYRSNPRSRGQLKRGEPRKGFVAVGAAHGFGGAQADAEGGAFRFSEKRAAEVGQQLDAGNAGRLAMRLDTHGGRFLEGLDPAESYAVLERHAPQATRRYRSETELRHLTGTGVSAAAVWRMREALDEAGFPKVRIVASSGFGVTKCRVMAEAKAPIDVVGTGSFIPNTWSETYATADIVAYDGVPRVKIGREFLLKRGEERRRNGGQL